MGSAAVRSRTLTGDADSMQLGSFYTREIGDLTENHRATISKSIALIDYR